MVYNFVKIELMQEGVDRWFKESGVKCGGRIDLPLWCSAKACAHLLDHVLGAETTLVSSSGNHKAKATHDP